MVLLEGLLTEFYIAGYKYYGPIDQSPKHIKNLNIGHTIPQAVEKQTDQETPKLSIQIKQAIGGQ